MIQSIFLEKGEIVFKYFCFVNLRSHILEIKENETFLNFQEHDAFGLFKSVQPRDPLTCTTQLIFHLFYFVSSYSLDYVSLLSYQIPISNIRPFNYQNVFVIALN